MFRIKELIMYDMNDNSYSYNFAAGINYFKGENGSGKTEFYSFIDYMFGSSDDIKKKPWYVDTLSKASMIFEYDDKIFCITRTREPNHNYLHYVDEVQSEAIDLPEYKDKLNSIFAQDIDLLKDIRNFTDEELTYRTFTMFNFLGEKGQGKIQDFLDKCSDIKYSIKLNSILNFIFNSNLKRIHELQKELDFLRKDVKELESNSSRFEFIITQVNVNLQKIGSNILYNGKNADEIKRFISSIKEMQNSEKIVDKRNIADLEVMYNNISEQIKVYENNTADVKQFKKDNENRRKLLFKLQELVEENNDFIYLVEPLQNILQDIEKTIFFSKYIINDNTIKELKKQREKIKNDIKRNDSRFKCYTLEQKSKAIALIEEYITVEVRFLDDDIKQKRKRIKEIREELKALQNADDTKKIKELSEYITKLYYSVKDISSVVADDMKQNEFNIKYLKKGNILQPMILSSDTDNIENYYIGSMARHTLIQLCGYLAFLKILLKDNKYPIIPILVIDHISKPFDDKNSKAIGKVISTAYESIGKEKLQTFIFDNEEHEKLDIQPEHFENLVSENKTGFNPFYFPSEMD